jgi:hypothetical protein
MGYHQAGHSALARPAHLVEGEEGHPGHEPVLPQPRQQGDVALEQDQAGVLGDRDEPGWFKWRVTSLPTWEIKANSSAS